MDVWWSAEVRIVVLVDGTGATEFNDCVYLLRSTQNDWTAAKLAAIAAARADETTYLNGDGQRVAWKVEKVLTLDALGADLGEPREIHSRFSDPDREIPFDTIFDPASHEPDQTGIPHENRGSCHRCGWCGRQIWW